MRHPLPDFYIEWYLTLQHSVSNLENKGSNYTRLHVFHEIRQFEYALVNTSYVI